MTPTEAEELGSREVEIETKKFVIEVKSNDQGRFVKIVEVSMLISKVHRVQVSMTSSPASRASFTFLLKCLVYFVMQVNYPWVGTNKWKMAAVL